MKRRIWPFALLCCAMVGKMLVTIYVLHSIFGQLWGPFFSWKQESVSLAAHTWVIFAYLFLLYLLKDLPRYAEEPRKLLAGKNCWWCGYSLAGTEATNNVVKCPECGHLNLSNIDRSPTASGLIPPPLAVQNKTVEENLLKTSKSLRLFHTVVIMLTTTALVSLVLFLFGRAYPRARIELDLAALLGESLVLFFSVGLVPPYMIYRGVYFRQKRAYREDALTLWMKNPMAGSGSR